MNEKEPARRENKRTEGCRLRALYSAVAKSSLLRDVLRALDTFSPWSRANISCFFLFYF